MDTVLYYFSGRGNSLSVARCLAERLEGAEIMPMAGAAGEVSLACKRVGLVMPVIDIGIPAYVRKFIKRLSAAGASYVFAVITCGGMPGSSMQQLDKLIKKQGLRLSAGWTLRFGLEKWTDEQWHGTLDEMACVISRGTHLKMAPAPFKDSLMTGLANPLARLIIPNEDRKFRVGESCTGCGTCASVCPVKNIEIASGKPTWQHRCEQCAACFSWCPNMAISGTCLAARTHYRNPRIELAQMLDEGR